jgi:MoxR-like ATPase
MLQPTRVIHIAQDDFECIDHLMDHDQYWAIEGALAANRPLLVRGEPGLGKTQLAYAAAAMLNRPIKHFTVDSATEARDLLWTFDAIQRLADAQVASHLYADRELLRNELAVTKYVRPGPLWWAIHWESAFNIDPNSAPDQPTGWTKDQGIVILIDEIDKAESNVPNGLLEVLGSRQFTPYGWSHSIRSEQSNDKKSNDAPLIIITTNEERTLPDPFIRRCCVLHLKLPDCVQDNGADLEEEDRIKFVDYFVELGKAHFPKVILEKQIRACAELLLEDRKYAVLNQVSPKPGPAEFLDFLRAMISLVKKQLGDGKHSKSVVENAYNEISQNIRQFVFSKSKKPDE